MTWEQALDSFEASIAQVEIMVGRGSWTEAPRLGTLSLAVGIPDAAQSARAAELQARCRRCTAAVQAAMEGTIQELRTLEHRRAAARGYLMSQVLRIAKPRGSGREPAEALPDA